MKGCWMLVQRVPVLAASLPRCSALRYLALPNVRKQNSAWAGLQAGAGTHAISALAGLWHLTIHGATRRPFGWVGLTQLTALECYGIAASEVRTAVLAIAALTGLRCLRAGLRDTHPLVLHKMQMRQEEVAEMTRHWLALTRLTMLDLREMLPCLGRSAAAQLSVRLAPLGRGLVPVDTPPHAPSEVPLKPLAGQGSRLDLAAVGLDDREVTDWACAAVLSPELSRDVSALQLR
jgi:hypothetical protein